MITDNQILSEFRKALKKYSGSDVLNLDDKFALQFTYTVQTFQEALPEFGYYIAPNKWSYYRIGLVTKGSADYVCGIYKFKAVENTLLIIPARVINTSTNWARDTEGYAIIFNLDFFLQSHFPYKYIENKRVLQPSIQPYLRLTNEQVKEVEAIFKTILQEQQSSNPDKRELITLKMIELLIVAERLYAEIQQPEITREISNRPFRKRVYLNPSLSRSKISLANNSSFRQRNCRQTGF